MYRGSIALLLITFLLAGSVLTACTPREPVISPDFAEEIKEALGYALAPTYLPEGFELTKDGDRVDPILIWGETGHFNLMYTKYSPSQGATLVLSYPETYGESNPVMERLGVTVPEDAISEIRINGETAFLFHGNWTLETLVRISQLITPLNPEWDYESNHISIRFAFSIPGGEMIWVWLGTLWPGDEVTTGDEVTEQDIIRIVESVVVVD